MKLITKLLSLAAAVGLTATMANAQISLQKVTTTVTPSTTISTYFTSTFSSYNDASLVNYSSFDAYAANDKLKWNGTFWANADTTPFTFTLTLATTLNYVENSGTTGSLTLDEVYTLTLTKTSSGTISIAWSLSSDNLPQTLNWYYANNYYIFTVNDALNSGTWTGITATNTTSIDDNLSISLVTNPVPEPSTYALMGASGLMALVGVRRIRSKKKTA